ncbi:MAG: MASE3 domain-containing protein [Syntrophales bacterium]|nr:MASE3 domain-containing protein [Syntrophales bacterium]
MKSHLTLSKYSTAIFCVLALPLIYFVSRYNYNLFHCLADGATIVIAASAFTIVWNSRHRADNDYFLYAGIAFLFFAFLDLMHLLGNKNMGVFPEYGNLGPTFYIASRYILSISLLIAPFFINRKLNTTIMFAAYSMVTSLILLSIFYWKIFPACIVEGVGLTPFKVVSDYIICLILLGSIGFLLINRQSFDSRVLWIIVSSIILSIATGLTFTLYTDPFGITNMAGHLFQIASFYLVYLAFIETSLNKPQEILFRKLKQNEEKLSQNLQQLDHTNVELNQEIAERKRAEVELRRQREWLQVTLASIGDAVIATDAAGRITFMNAVAEAITGWTLPDALQKPVKDVFNIINENTRCEAENPVARVFREGVTIGLANHTLLVRKDGMEVPIDDSAAPLMDQDGETLGVVLVFRDISERRQAERSQAEHAAKLEEINKELEGFSYSVSHDLRAPLRAITGYSQMILKKQGELFDEETRRRFRMITTNAETMGRLIDDLLSFSRLGSQVVAKGSLDMEELIVEVWQELVTINPDREMTLRICPMTLSCGDRTLIRQVYSNLLGNAAKFTRERDGALIEAGSCIRDGETVYYVRDNGVGFDMQFYDKLFGVFQRLHSDEAYKGTGIGLALVKRIINRHGGRVWAEGEVGTGAIFYFTLPRKEPQKGN